ncbi:MAG: hypothetical protein ACSNEK_07460 [Parachlamydiaceae bacterium]
MSFKRIFQKNGKTKDTKQSPSRIIPPNPITQLKIRYNVGYPNNLFIRGQGAGLSWEKGVPLRNISSEEWLWETNEIFPYCHYKILINDQHYEVGDNHELRCGSSTEHRPHF